MDVMKKNQDALERIKTSVRRSYDAFKHNYDRYNEFRRFVFESSLREEDITLLMTLNKPQLEFNVLEAYISRLLGEWSKQEPDIIVSADDESRADPNIITLLNQYFRHEAADQDNSHMRWEVYKDLLSGGFSVIKVYTKYAHAMSMNQEICSERAFDPTMCGFDTLAKTSHKGDGQFCFELFPMTLDEFKQKFPNVDTSKVNYRRDFAGFNWSYLNETTPTLIVADYYEKKIRPEKIVQLRDGQVITEKQYNKMLKEWTSLLPPPAIIGKPRKTELEYIVRTRCIETEIIEVVETDFEHLPLIFVDGNSILVRTPKNGNIRQVTRPYVYHAKGAQKLKNYAGISLANEIENIVQHKFMVAKEALPKEQDFLAAYKDIQKASVLVHNAFFEQDPDKIIPEPIREVNRIPAPPEIMQGFSGADSLIQNILGSYDASLGINNNQLSGIAIVEGATQSNSTAMPYVVGAMQGFQRDAEIKLSLIPKYFTTPRTIPVMDEDGKRSFVKINQEGGINLFYEPSTLNVTVKAGASFQVQKSRTIMMIKEMMGMSPLFAQFISEKGLGFILDNVEGKNIEQLKSMVKEWTDQLEAQKQRAQAMQEQMMQNNPAVMKNNIEMQKLNQNAQKMHLDFAADMAKLKADENKILADLEQSHNDNTVQMIKAETERFSKNVDLHLKNRDMSHRHKMDHLNKMDTQL